MKHGDLIVALGICMGMSACASQYVKHELGAKHGHVAADYQYQVILDDQLVAQWYKASVHSNSLKRNTYSGL